MLGNLCINSIGIELFQVQVPKHNHTCPIQFLWDTADGMVNWGPRLMGWMVWDVPASPIVSQWVKTISGTVWETSGSLIII